MKAKTRGKPVEKESVSNEEKCQRNMQCQKNMEAQNKMEKEKQPRADRDGHKRQRSAKCRQRVGGLKTKENKRQEQSFRRIWRKETRRGRRILGAFGVWSCIGDQVTKKHKKKWQRSVRWKIKCVRKKNKKKRRRPIGKKRRRRQKDGEHQKGKQKHFREDAHVRERNLACKIAKNVSCTM